MTLTYISTVPHLKRSLASFFNGYTCLCHLTVIYWILPTESTAKSRTIRFEKRLIRGYSYWIRLIEIRPCYSPVSDFSKNLFHCMNGSKSSSVELTAEWRAAPIWKWSINLKMAFWKDDSSPQLDVYYHSGTHRSTSAVTIEAFCADDIWCDPHALR